MTMGIDVSHPAANQRFESNSRHMKRLSDLGLVGGTPRVHHFPITINKWLVRIKGRKDGIVFNKSLGHIATRNYLLFLSWTALHNAANLFSDQANPLIGAPRRLEPATSRLGASQSEYSLNGAEKVSINKIPILNQKHDWFVPNMTVVFTSVAPPNESTHWTRFWMLKGNAIHMTSSDS